MLTIFNLIKTFLLHKRNIYIFAAIILAMLFSYIGWKTYIYHKPPVINNTKVIIQEVRKISQLFTYRYYDECVSDLKDKDDDEPYYVIIARGTVFAGYDLSSLDEKNSFIIKGNTLTVKIDPPKVMDVIILPSGFEPFIWKRAIKQEERVAAQKKAVDIIKKNAIDKGILKLSETQGTKILTNFFESLGFDEVTVEINQPALDPAAVKP